MAALERIKHESVRVKPDSGIPQEVSAARIRGYF